MGTMIMLMISNIILRELTSMNWPASLSIRRGVRNGEARVVKDVIVTDRATSPRAR